MVVPSRRLDLAIFICALLVIATVMTTSVYSSSDDESSTCKCGPCDCDCGGGDSSDSDDDGDADEEEETEAERFESVEHESDCEYCIDDYGGLD